MANIREVVIHAGKAPARFHADWNEGVALLLHLQAYGHLREIASRLRLHRGGGYAGIDIFVFLLLYFASGFRKGIKAFSGRIGAFNERLAAIVDRARLPTQSSVSRLLADVTFEVVRPQTKWLLRDVGGVIELLRHPCMTTLDAKGKAWHVLHYDPTKTALRQRALPEGEDLPTARRRTEGFAGPGYAGRKRGEVQFSRSALQHAGSGIWLDTRLAPGNGDRRRALGSALEAAVELGQRLDHPLSRIVVVEDGEFGDVPSLTAHREAGVCTITRLNRPALLDQPEIRQQMANQPWYVVPDSGSGPRRSAMDLGTVTVRPDKETVRDNGKPYEPISTRVVVSRYLRGKEAEHGRVINGWQYELFVALDLDEAAWPAPDAVAEFFARGALENRFAQEDRELELDRVYSYELPGQELACVVGLLVWNLELVRGFALNPLPEERIPAPARTVEVDPRPVPDGFVEPVLNTVEPVNVVPVDTAKAEPDVQTALADALCELDWKALLARRPSWRFSRAEAELRCPADRALPLCSVNPKASASTHGLVFLAHAGTCQECPLRASCLASAAADAVKVLTVAVPAEVGAKISTLLVPVQMARRKKRSAETLAAPLPSGQARPPAPRTPLVTDIPEQPTPPGGAQISRGQFLPTAARAALRLACERLTIDISLVVPPRKPPHPYLVASPEQRQHRRATWTQRTAWNAIYSEADLRVVIEGGDLVAAAFSWARPAKMTG